MATTSTYLRTVVGAEEGPRIYHSGIKPLSLLTEGLDLSTIHPLPSKWDAVPKEGLQQEIVEEEMEEEMEEEGEAAGAENLEEFLWNTFLAPPKKRLILRSELEAFKQRSAEAAVSHPYEVFDQFNGAVRKRMAIDDSEDLVRRNCEKRWEKWCSQDPDCRQMLWGFKLGDEELSWDDFNDKRWKAAYGDFMDGSGGYSETDWTFEEEQ